MVTSKRVGLVGNGWVLAGGVPYLLEFVAIIWGSLRGVGTQTVSGSPATEVMATHVRNADVVHAMAGWFAVVLLGQVLLFIGLRRALADSGHRHPCLTSPWPRQPSASPWRSRPRVPPQQLPPSPAGWGSPSFAPPA